MFDQLNLPNFDIELRKADNQEVEVFDPLRRKWVVLTPEEWVRQHFARYLTTALGVPPTFVANEVGVRLNGRQRRCDTVIYRRNLEPLCIVEYKRPTVSITAAVFDQIARYNMVLGCPWLMVSNGLRHFACRFDGTKYTFLPELPTYEQMNSFNIK